jgi:glycosyltransferase involved in cell wall biosynthesis
VVDAFAALGLPVTHIPTDNTGPREVAALRRALAAVDADVLLADRPRDLRLAALASLGRRTVLVSRYNLSRTRPPPDLLSRLAYRRVRLTIFVSEALARRALPQAGYLRRPLHLVVPEGVDPERFRPDRAGAAAFRAAYDLGDAPFILAVGALSPEKRYDVLLDAVAALGSSRWPLVVCGEGPLIEPLRARARELGVDARFIGLVPPERLPGAYTAAACMVHACPVETFGLSVLEAMACEAAVVAVGEGGVAEVVADAGVLVPADDPGAFAAALGGVLLDDGRRRALGIAGRRRALASFTVARMRQAYVDAIESVASDRRG